MDTTKQHLEAINRFLDRLIRRERVLLSAEWGGLVLGSATLVGMVAAIMLSVGVSVGVVSLTVFVLVFVVLAACGWLSKGRWRKSSNLAGQARDVEMRLPGLRGRLVTVVERAENLGGASEVLFDRAAKHAHQAVRMVQPADVHSSKPALRVWSTLVSLMIVVSFFGSRMPVGPLDAARVLLGHSAAAIRLADTEEAPEEDAALVGDITLRYVFPDYTGMEPREVPNSNGTIIAPPGTKVFVRARSADSFDAAALQLDDGDPIDADLVGGRDVSASLVVEQSGTWRVLLFAGAEVRSSPPYEVKVEADQPPVVVTSETGQKVAPVDAPLGLGWQATDDYGMVRVNLEVVRTGDLSVEVIREPLEPVTELNGVIWNTPRQLGLQPGDTVELRVVAVDNDRLEGGNRGASETITLQVLGPRGYGKNLARYHEKLRDALLDVLADFLEDPVPPAESREGLIRWLYSARLRFDPVRQVLEEQWGDESPSGIDGELVEDVMEASGRLFRFTMTTFDRQINAGGQQPIDEDFETFFQLHAQTVEQLEIAVFVIDSMLREVGVSELARQAKIVAEKAGELVEVAEQSDDAGLMTTRLDQLERQLGKLRRAAAKLQDENLAGFVDGTIDQSEAMSESIRSAISGGNFDQARTMMKLLEEQLKQLAESLSERDLRRQEAAQEMNERFAQLMEDLDTLADDQDAAAQRLATAQDDQGAEFSELVAIWEKLDALAAKFERQMEATISGVGDGRGWQPYTIKRIEELVHLSRGIRDSVRGRDIQGVALRVTEAGVSISTTQRFIMRTLRSSDAAEGAKKVEVSLLQAFETQKELASLLTELAARPEESSPELLAIAEEVSAQQALLQDRQRILQDEVREIESAMPTSTGAAAKSMRQAGEAMERARSSLDGGLPMQGEGQQRHAAMLVRETKEHLQQASDKQQQMEQMMQRMKGQRSEDGSKTSNNMVNADIPAPELFKTPEEYRQALLEGMAGSVPDEFKALKRRFYEDLVRQ